jgi:peptide/nickel transport system substrate-binding protein
MSVRREPTHLFDLDGSSQGRPPMRHDHALVNAFVDRRLNRRDFVLRATALGMAPALVAAVLGDAAGTAAAPRRVVRAQGTPGGTLVFGAWQTPDTMDPQKTGLAATGRILANVFDSLVVRFPGDDTIYPGLAEGWEISDDGTEYTFFLRQDVTFHNGEPFTAESIKYTFDREADPANQTLEAPPRGFDHVEVVDDYTARVVFNDPFAPFLTMMAATAWLPIAPQYAAENPEGMGLTPPGTGPFSITEYQHGSHLVLDRNPDYNWAVEDHFGRQGPTLLDRIDWRIIAEPGTRAATLESGETNLIEEIVPAQVENFRSNPAYQIIDQGTTGCPRSVQLNCTKAPTDDRLVRQAMNYAVDKRVITDVVFRGTVDPAFGPLEQLTPGYNPEVEEYYPYDPEMARQLLDEAGWIMNGEYRAKDGQELSALFIVIAKDNFDEPAQVIQSQLREVGINLELTSEAEPTVFNTYNRGEQNLGNIFWWAADPEALYSLYHSSQIEKGFNWSHYTNPEVDALLEQGYTETDTEARLEIYGEAQRLIMDDAPLIPIWGKKVLMAGQTAIAGLDFNLIGYPLFYNTTASE